MRDRFSYRIDQKGYELWIGLHDKVQSSAGLSVPSRDQKRREKPSMVKSLTKNALLQLTKSLSLDLEARFVLRRRGFFGPHQIVGEFMGQKLIGQPLKGAVKWDLLGLSDEARETFVELLRQRGSIVGFTEW
jgi:hypothetical protein